MSNLPFTIYSDTVNSVSNSSTTGLGLVNPPPRAKLFGAV